MKKIFIDGSAGTTGLRIYDRLSKRSDIELITLSDELRKDASARADAMNSSDVTFLCLPDDAAIEAISFVSSPDTVVIDTSTAHRVAPGWTYGFPEIAELKDKIKNSKRIANPGCHASGFIALVAPLIEAGLIYKEEKLSCFSLTGYSGGGKKMIAEYENKGRPEEFDSPRMYGLSQEHKHLPEMRKVSGLESAPVFCPVVSDFYSGMEVTVPLFDRDMDKIKKIYMECYGSGMSSNKSEGCSKEASSGKGGMVYFSENADEDGFISASKMAGRDSMQISVSGNNERLLLTARFDNLGKGASGAAIQNMNIALGLPESSSLVY